MSGMHGHDQILLKAPMSTAAHCNIGAVGALAVYVRTYCVHRFGGKCCKYGHRRPDCLTINCAHYIMRRIIEWLNFFVCVPRRVCHSN